MFIGNETGIIYTLLGPGGERAVFNDPTDADYVGGLTSEEGVTGLDGAEIVESFSQRPEDDGATQGNFYFGRRPITFAGEIAASTPEERNERTGKIRRAVGSLMRADGTLSFTPSGGEPVFVNVRAQQPWRVRGGWVKEFFVGLVASDPRIYSLAQMTAYAENTTDTALNRVRRLTWASGTGTSLATRDLYLPAGDWTARAQVRLSDSSLTVEPVMNDGSVERVDVDGARYNEAALALDPAIYLPLDATNGATDLSGNGYTATGAGSVTIGGYSPGPLAVGDDGATDFDGTDDRITTDYETRRNLVTNPRGGAGATTGWSTAAGLVNSGATVSAVNAWRDTSLQIDTDGVSTLQGAYIKFNLTSGENYQARIRLNRTAGSGTIRVAVVRNSSPWTTHEVVAAGTQTGFTEATLDFTANYTGEWALIVEVNEASASTVQFTECLIEAGDGTYFDGSGYYDDSGNWISDPGGHVGWLGTEHASASDKGCFANGCVRTHSLWFYRDATTDHDPIWSTTSDSTPANIPFIRAQGSTNELYITADNSDGGNTEVLGGITPGAWWHLVVVFDQLAGEYRSYINGILVATHAAAFEYPPINGDGYQIGKYTPYSGAANHFDGKMQGVAVYERGLTGLEITNLFKSGIGNQFLSATDEDDWFDVQRHFTTINAEGTATEVEIEGGGFASGKYVELGPVTMESPVGQAPSNTAAEPTNWAAGAGYTASWQATGPAPGIHYRGGVDAWPTIVLHGPWTNILAVAGDNRAQLNPTSVSATQWVRLDTFNRTVRLYADNLSVYAYLYNHGVNTVFDGIQPGFNTFDIPVYAGGSTSTKMLAHWRDTYI